MSLIVELSQTVNCQDVVKIARDACHVILQVYNSQAESWNVEHKADDSPLTRADKEANAVICDGLARIGKRRWDNLIYGWLNFFILRKEEFLCITPAVAPHIPVVSEENQQVAYETRKGYQYSWCVDPLDGTKEFVKRNGQFTVNIALLRGSRPVLGVVAVPVDGTVYWAAKGQGAFVQRTEQDGPQRLQCAEVDMSQSGLVVVASASHLTPETQEFVAQLQAPTFQQLGSSLKLLMVAEGVAHVYPRLAPTCEWDTAAAHAIVEEAGGCVLQAGLCDSKGKLLEDWKAALAKQIPVQYNKEIALNPYFVVYGRTKKLIFPHEHGTGMKLATD
ncbi:3'-(2'-),5'-bisphosphate nucleotidase CysQ [Chlorella vulgaris]